MKRIACFILLFGVVGQLYAQRVDRRPLGDVVTDSVAGVMYDNLEAWRTDRREGFLAMVAKLPQTAKNAVISRAEKYLTYTFPALPATLYLQYKETGNRTNFQDVQSDRRHVLSTLVLAELFEGRGRFTDQIINGIWAVCEETSWCLPAHQSARAKRMGLPVPGEHVVDLIVGEDAATMSWILLLLGDRLDARTVAVTQRIRYELHRRIIVPNLTKEFNRMCLDGSPTNNWTVWVSRNWLWTLSMAGCTSREEFVGSVGRLVRSVDNYISWYPSDGGCDEGVSYWRLSPPFYYDIVEFFDFMLPGRFDTLRKSALLKNMVSYVSKMEIDKNYYVNFADGSPFTTPDVAAIYLWGRFLDDADLMGFAAFNGGAASLEKQLATARFHRYFNIMRAWEGLGAVEPRRHMPAFSVFPDLEVMTARDRKGSPDGLFVAAKGGHNQESHNHNDIGSFIISCDGAPVLVDIGVGTYTAQTFSKDRYSIWTMQSGWHNTPTVNGYQQKSGRQYCASDVSIDDRGGKAVFSADISKAYPAEAGIETWQRRVTLERGRKVVVEDEYYLRHNQVPVEYNLVTPLNVDISREGLIVMDGTVRGRHGKARVAYDKGRFRVEVDTMEITDKKLQKTWGNRMSRIRLVSLYRGLKGSDRIEIMPVGDR